MNTNSESSTDIITISRSILKQALEALEKHQEALRAWPEHTLAPHECVAMDASEKAIAGLRAALAQQDEPVAPVAWYRPSIAPDYYAPVFVEGAQPPAPLTQAEARLLGWRPLVPPKAEPVGRCEDCGMKYCECGERR